jgi:hypothetical protein
LKGHLSDLICILLVNHSAVYLTTKLSIMHVPWLWFGCGLSPKVSCVRWILRQWGLVEGSYHVPSEATKLFLPASLKLVLMSGCHKKARLAEPQ